MHNVIKRERKVEKGTFEYDYCYYYCFLLCDTLLHYSFIYLIFSFHFSGYMDILYKLKGKVFRLSRFSAARILLLPK